MITNPPVIKQFVVIKQSVGTLRRGVRSDMVVRMARLALVVVLVLVVAVTGWLIVRYNRLVERYLLEAPMAALVGFRRAEYFGVADSGRGPVQARF